LRRISSVQESPSQSAVRTGPFLAHDIRLPDASGSGVLFRTSPICRAQGALRAFVLLLLRWPFSSRIVARRVSAMRRSRSG
jgi:hypothetical protein